MSTLLLHILVQWSWYLKLYINFVNLAMLLVSYPCRVMDIVERKLQIQYLMNSPLSVFICMHREWRLQLTELIVIILKSKTAITRDARHILRFSYRFPITQSDTIIVLFFGFDDHSPTDYSLFSL